MLAAEGITIDRSTLVHRVGFAAFELIPVYDCLVANLKSSSKLFAHETRWPVLVRALQDQDRLSVGSGAR